MSINHSLLPAVKTATLPEKYLAAKVAIALCVSIDECKDWVDKAKALASYARMSEDKELEHNSMRIRARAIRRCGELLGQIKGAPGKRTDIQPNIPENTRLPTRKEAAEKAKLSPAMANYALRVARVNGDSFEQQVESDHPPTVKELAEQGKQKSNRVPFHEQLGITVEAMRAIMHFRGAIERYAKILETYEPKDVAGGANAEDRKTILVHMRAIQKYHQKLRSRL